MSDTTDTQLHELAIIGAGPIGLELAVACKRARIDYLHFDAKQIGYTISWFAPQTHFFSSNERIAIADVPLQTPDQSKATREQYLSYLRQVVQQFDLQVKTYEPVVGIEKKEGIFHLFTQPQAGTRQYRFRNIVLATGGTARPQRLNIPGEELPHVSHYFQDPHLYFRKRLLVVGGRNSAVEAALRCHHAGAQVALSYRRDQFDEKSVKYWLLPEIKAYMQSGKITGYFNTHPTAICDNHVTLADRDGKSLDVSADFVLLMTGYEADMSLCRMAGVEITQPGDRPVFDPQTMQSNVPGVYLAGTVTGGTQSKYTVFIENCHIHVDRILASLRGWAPPPEKPGFVQVES